MQKRVNAPRIVGAYFEPSALVALATILLGWWADLSSLNRYGAHLAS